MVCTWSGSAKYLACHIILICWLSISPWIWVIINECIFLVFVWYSSGCHKPGKHGTTWKTQGIWKLSKSQGKLREIWTLVEKTWKTQGKWNYVTWSPTKMHSIEFSSLELLRKKFKIPWKSQGKLRELCFSKMWPPWCITIPVGFQLCWKQNGPKCWRSFNPDMALAFHVTSALLQLNVVCNYKI